MGKQGIIIKGLGGLYSVLTDDNLIINCKARGSFRHSGDKPYIGDEVELNEDDTFISEIKERKNYLIRPPVSNVSNLFIIIASAEPEPILLNVDKLTCVSEHNGIRPIIIVTKSEINKERANEIYSIYSSVGYNTFLTDQNGSGDDEISDFIKNECRNGISCFAGASGVGKSTLMSRLFPSLSLETGEISAKIQRGKHTTRKVDLYSLNELYNDSLGGYIADTPGFSMIDFINFDFIDLPSLVNTFPEFDKYIGKCRYTKCTHLCEEGCSICEALNNGEIKTSRHDNYKIMYGELKQKKPYEKKAKV